jgi:hypothetical protein
MTTPEKFLAFLKVELADLDSEIQKKMSACEWERDRGEITNYVCLENRCVLKNELTAIDRCFGVLADITPGSFGEVTDLIHDIRSRFSACIKRCGLYEAILPDFDLRVKKVIRLLEVQ